MGWEVVKVVEPQGLVAEAFHIGMRMHRPHGSSAGVAVGLQSEGLACLAVASALTVGWPGCSWSRTWLLGTCHRSFPGCACYSDLVSAECPTAHSSALGVQKGLVFGLLPPHVAHLLSPALGNQPSDSNEDARD